jgi:hypothetical protein
MINVLCVIYKLGNDIENNITEKSSADPLANSGKGIMPYVRHLAIPVILEAGRA